ncbi:MAG: hypothetical protein J3K34DRAFT_402181 [Monoraphidium minutum]|nr:MAG: hypothetical protein J3K34DRAFT_402181 [Monoraphidium minutum]
MASFLMLLNMSVLTSALRGAFKSSKAPAAAAKTPKTTPAETTPEVPATEYKTPASKTPSRRASSASDASAAAKAPERSTSPAVCRIKEAYLKSAAGAHAAFNTVTSPSRAPCRAAASLTDLRRARRPPPSTPRPPAAAAALPATNPPRRRPPASRRPLAPPRRRCPWPPPLSPRCPAPAPSPPPPPTRSAL